MNRAGFLLALAACSTTPPGKTVPPTTASGSTSVASAAPTLAAVPHKLETVRVSFGLVAVESPKLQKLDRARSRNAGLASPAFEWKNGALLALRKNGPGRVVAKNAKDVWMVAHCTVAGSSSDNLMRLHTQESDRLRAFRSIAN